MTLTGPSLTGGGWLEMNGSDVWLGIRIHPLTISLDAHDYERVRHLGKTGWVLEESDQAGWTIALEALALAGITR